jgi:hypothetical protein
MTSTRNKAAKLVIGTVFAALALSLSGCQENHYPYAWTHRKLHSHGHIPYGAAQHGNTGSAHFWRKSKPVQPPQEQAVPDTAGGGRMVNYGK